MSKTNELLHLSDIQVSNVNITRYFIIHIGIIKYNSCRGRNTLCKVQILNLKVQGIKVQSSFESKVKHVEFMAYAIKGW